MVTYHLFTVNKEQVSQVRGGKRQCLTTLYPGLQVWLIADIGLEGSFEDPSKTRLAKTKRSEGSFEDPSKTRLAKTKRSEGSFEDPSKTRLFVGSLGSQDPSKTRLFGRPLGSRDPSKTRYPQDPQDPNLVFSRIPRIPPELVARRPQECLNINENERKTTFLPGYYL